MKREDDFLISHKPFAVRSGVLRTAEHTGKAGKFYGASVDAVWYRRKAGVTYAVVGLLWDYQDTEPRSVEEFLHAAVDGRYGGSAQATWDGRRYHPLGPDAADERNRVKHLELLRPMMAHAPLILPGYTGWWTFRD